MSSNQHEEHPPVPYRVYIGVWAALITLTAITVGVSYVDMRNVTVLTAVLIATIKGMLVILYFMHVRFEKPLYAFMILATLTTYGIFISLTFVDYYYR
jgi:cytochrome c oxidase subunit 4